MPLISLLSLVGLIFLKQDLSVQVQTVTLVEILDRNL